jgi:hypothetical protein
MIGQETWESNRPAVRSGDIADYVGRLGGLAAKAINLLRSLDINEATFPDAFRKAPKLISPRVHAWMDVAVTGYFLGVGAWFLRRRKTGAAASAFLNAAMMAGVSLFTDYYGDGRKPISFKLHGTLDAVQAASAAMGPVIHGFAGERDAAFFYGQAINGIAVIASTDWEARMGEPRRT